MSRSTSRALAALALVLASAPARAQGSDDCPNAQPISGFGAHAFDSSAATTGTDGQVVSCSLTGLGIDNDVWFLWTASTTGDVLVSTCLQTSVDTKIAVYPGGACPTNNPLACSDDDCVGQSQTVFSATFGLDYLIQIGSSPGNPGGTGTFSLGLVGPMTNDNCGQAIAISGAGPFYFDNSIATTGLEGQNNPGCVGVKNDLWYLWSAPANGTATLSTCAQTGIDSAVAVYFGAGCPAFTSLACDDDACNLQSQTTFLISAGNFYTLQIGSSGGLSGGIGTFRVDVTTTPAHDDCATPLSIGTAGGAAYDTTSATTGGEGQSNPCGAIEHDLWFEWTAPASGLATVDTCGQTGLDTSIAVYPAGTCPQSVATVCDNDGCPGGGSQSSLSFTAAVGSTYLFQLGSAPGVAGGPSSFLVTLSGPTVTPFCFGDGTATACPCGNSGAPGQGCASSTNPSGALLTASGTASVSADTLLLECSGMPNGTSIYLQGTQPLNGGLGLPFGDGLRCVGGSLIRLGAEFNVNGTSAYGGPAGDIPVSIRGQLPPEGGTRTYQCWYRNPVDFCTPDFFNLSNGLEIVWVP